MLLYISFKLKRKIKFDNRVWEYADQSVKVSNSSPSATSKMYRFVSGNQARWFREREIDESQEA